MASLTHTDLLEPTGEVAASFFPGDDATALAARLDAYLADGYARADAAYAPPLAEPARNEAARQWAYVRAGRAVLYRLSVLESSATVQGAGAVTVTRTDAQRATFAAFVAEHLAAFEAIVPPTSLLATNAPAAAAPLVSRVTVHQTAY